MTNHFWRHGAYVTLLLAGCAQSPPHGARTTSVGDTKSPHATANAHDLDDEEDEDGDESAKGVDVPLASVPDAVKAAAVGAVPGLVLTSAEKETEDGAVVYTLEGEVNGVEYEVEVSADGQVKEVEHDGDDDEHH